MSSKLSSDLIKRYQNQTIIDHLASNYVLGLLKPLVRLRVETLRKEQDYKVLDEQISYWQAKLSPLDTLTPELTPDENTWAELQRKLDIGDVSKNDSKVSFGFISKLSSFSFWQVSSVFSLLLCALLGFNLIQQQSLGPLSYVAVLEDDAKNPQLVASTYGESQQLILDIINLPNLDEEQTFELWVVSKTDQQVRSLGEVPKDAKSFKRMLSNAEWRLIKDSLSLKLSIEDEGGSAIGEPSELIVSRGLCIRLEANETQS